MGGWCVLIVSKGRNENGNRNERRSWFAGKKGGESQLLNENDSVQLSELEDRDCDRHHQNGE